MNNVSVWIQIHLRKLNLSTNILKTRILSLESLFRELSREQIFARALSFCESFANVVLAFAEPSYFNSPLNLHLEVLAAAHFSHLTYHITSHTSLITSQLITAPLLTPHFSHTHSSQLHFSHLTSHTSLLTPHFSHHNPSQLHFSHHLSHTLFDTPSFTHHLSRTHLCHPPSLTHHLSHTTLSHTHTQSFTHNFVTHHLSHTALSHTIFRTPSFTHIIFHTQLCHTPSFLHLLLCLSFLPRPRYNISGLFISFF